MHSLFSKSTNIFFVILCFCVHKFAEYLLYQLAHIIHHSLCRCVWIVYTCVFIRRWEIQWSRGRWSSWGSIGGCWWCGGRSPSLLILTWSLCYCRRWIFSWFRSRSRGCMGWWHGCSRFAPGSSSTSSATTDILSLFGREKKKWIELFEMWCGGEWRKVCEEFSKFLLSPFYWENSLWAH